MRLIESAESMGWEPSVGVFVTINNNIKSKIIGSQLLMLPLFPHKY